MQICNSYFSVQSKMKWPLVLILCVHLSFAINCDVFSKQNKHLYSPLRHCQRSNQTIIGWGNADSLEKCQDFAKFKKGMAFNFSPKGRSSRNRFENKTKSWNDKPENEIFYNCQVLNCPEFRNFSTMINDTRFDYYSLFAFPPPFQNSTCIPEVGMFLYYSQPENYTVAQNVCLSIGGNLAHILSETRTTKLSKFMDKMYRQQMNHKIAYIGLNETEVFNSTTDTSYEGGRTFLTAAEEPILCFDYRAWAPGHPRQTTKMGKKSLNTKQQIRRKTKEETPSERQLRLQKQREYYYRVKDLNEPRCGVITREYSWQTVSCKRKLPFICELMTSGPDKRIKTTGTCSLKRANNKNYWEERVSEDTDTLSNT